MKLKVFFDKAIEAGIKNDPRGQKTVKEFLKKRNDDYKQLSDKKKALFDMDKLENPYDDSKIHYGDPGKDIKRVMVGVDMEVPELLLADRLTQKGKSVDMVVAHHPEGRAFAGFYEVMEMQADIFNSLGVPINVAESLTEERMGEVSRSVSASNHMRSVDAARLLDIAFINLHTPSDNCVTTFLQSMFDRKKPVYVEQVVDALEDIPEYRMSRSNKSPASVLLGKKKNRAGKIFVDMTGGTGPSKDIYPELKAAGVGTIVGMHMGENSYKKAKECRMNVVIAGHISSDSLGLNLLLDEILKHGKVDIVPAGGFIRVERKSKK